MIQLTQWIDPNDKIWCNRTKGYINNAQWLNTMNFSDVVGLASKYTVARMMERDDFEKRYKSEIPITIHEFLYPLAQAMDSVHLKADFEIGGTDANKR